jgi:hypothetical protein
MKRARLSGLPEFKGEDEFISRDMGGAILYRPNTQETRQTYDVFLSFMQNAIGDLQVKGVP